jgi:hypothetical protein
MTHQANIQGLKASTSIHIQISIQLQNQHQLLSENNVFSNFTCIFKIKLNYTYNYSGHKKPSDYFSLTEELNLE